MRRLPAMRTWPRPRGESLLRSAADGIDAALAARLEAGGTEGADRAAGYPRPARRRLRQRGRSEVGRRSGRRGPPGGHPGIGQHRQHRGSAGLMDRLHGAKTPEETAVVQEALRTACGRVARSGRLRRKLRDCMTAASLADQCFLVGIDRPGRRPRGPDASLPPMPAAASRSCRTPPPGRWATG